VIYAVDGARMAELAKPVPPRLTFRDQTQPRPLEPRSLAVGKVNYVGQPVAAVVALSQQSAEAALDLIAVDYELLAVVDNADAALAPGAPIVHEGWTSNLVTFDTIKTGDVDAAFAMADCVTTGTLSFASSTSAPIETRCYVAQWDERARRMTCTGTFQMPHASRWALALALDIPESDVRIVAPNMGGTFGLKMSGHPEEVLTAALARMTGRPIAFIEDRAACLSAPGREQRHVFEIAARRDGTIVGFRNVITVDSGVVATGAGWSMALVTASVFPSVYRVENCRVDCTIAATNKAPWQAIRGYGKEIANLVMERAIDLLAHDLGMNPIELRRRNLIPKTAFPYLMPSGMNLDSGDYEGALAQLTALFGHDAWRDRQKRPADGTRIGIGIGFELTPEGGARPGVMPSGFETATVRVEPSGQVKVITGVTSPGGGNETGIAQLVADTIGVRPEGIRVVQGDTDITPVGTGNGSSRSTMYAGAAAVMAARDVREKLAQCAANIFVCSPDDIIFADSAVFSRQAPDRRVTISEIAQRAHMHVFTVAKNVELPLQSTRTYKPDNIRLTPDAQGRISTYPSFPYSVHAAAIELELATGNITVLDYALVHDSGVIVNPAMVSGQLRGAVTMGIGAALWEELVFDAEGHLVSNRLKSYLMPRAPDLPALRVGHRCTPSPFHPLGMKGVGESGVGGAMASVFNAVADAMGPAGRRLANVPATAPRILRALVGSE
jgi:carbon-monoxide dehydrogenase large subunit